MAKKKPKTWTGALGEVFCVKCGMNRSKDAGELVKCRC